MGYDLLNPFSLFLFLVAMFALSLAVYASTVQQRHAMGIAGALLGSAIWAGADALKIAATADSAVIFWNQVSYLGVVTVAPSVLWFAAAYTDRTYWLDYRRFGVFVTLSALALVIALTNPSGLWRAGETVTPSTAPPVLEEEFGFAHVLWQVYVVLFLVPLSYGLLLSEFRSKRSSLFRQQISLMLVGFIVPFLCSVLFITGLTPVDLTPFGFIVFGIVVLAAVSNCRLLDIVPVARDVVIENVDSGIVVLDDDGQVVDTNTQAKVVLGRDDAVYGEQFTDVFGEFEAVTDLLQPGADDNTTVTLERGGETYHYHTTGSTITNDGDVLGTVLIFSEITERIRREEQLVERTAELKEKNEQLDEFASIVSHDLRNPLNVAQLWTDTLKDDIDNEAVEKVDQSLDRMESIVTSVLALTRQQDPVEKTETLSLETSAREAWSYIDAQDATLDVRDDSQLNADRSRIGQLFENLYRNAIEHGGSAVTVTVEPTDTGFAVADDGPGIDPDKRDQVFETGYTTNDEGTGFGLSIVERIVDAHGWEVKITDSESGGVRFEFQTE